MTASAKPKFQGSVVTKAELEELRAWETKYAGAKLLEANAEKQVKARRLALMKKVLLIDSADELKELSPEQLDRKLGMYQAGGLWKLAQNAPKFEFVKTNEGSYPAWKQLYIGELGEAAAAKIAADTPKTYSYRVDVKL